MTITKQKKIEGVTSVKRGWRYTAEQKIELLNEARLPGVNSSFVARKYGNALSQVCYCRRRMEDGALTAVGSEEKGAPECQVRELEAKIRRLECVPGQKTVDIEILR